MFKSSRGQKPLHEITKTAVNETEPEAFTFCKTFTGAGVY